jgi:hypothetical protein
VTRNIDEHAGGAKILELEHDPKKFGLRKKPCIGSEDMGVVDIPVNNQS